ncbi:serine/threonine-protein kinase LMTK1 isoform X2 [Nothobranchius furzeri]|uniref:non-specific serine/threonine protein kinase n=2 Tax=Nothobranchius furzeri TaxID=105023 RepID=A0A8C6LYH2_NOTFU|nr:serine/threonine-protein kinase LMTK1 isoform X5 [Nothobranchius furzeri]KAF7225502.1 transcript variant X2 [Nothobranchius furzeri]
MNEENAHSVFFLLTDFFCRPNRKRDRRMMLCVLHVIMSSAFFNPSFAFSSHFATDSAPLSELSWPSSLAVVVVSFSGLFTFVFLMLACICCKKGDIRFKEFENTEGEEYQADLSALALPSSQNGPEVYILPLTEVSLPVSKQPGRSMQLQKSSDIGRHSLVYLGEIGHGWFGRVVLAEVSTGVPTTKVVVKELNASASIQDQIKFLEEAQPYWTLQHPALLQCLAQCSEVTPYLLVMEFCPLGDLKNYLCSCQATDSETPDTLILQKMACDIASGLHHLHKYNFIHSDLALRNCLLTSEMSVKIGDYSLSHSRYKGDYYITQDQIWVPLRWIAPELIDEVHGNLLVVDQTKSSNIWSLGVTFWELFELGNQPYRQYSDRQVLTHAVKEQQLKLPKPQLQLPLDDHWYEVMQFCWLQPELRPSSEEVHLLVTHLCGKCSTEVKEDFTQHWNTLRPNLLVSTLHTASSKALVLTPTPTSADLSSAEQTQAVELASSAPSCFPLLEHFSDSFHSDTGDDLLTVTETSHGLKFEYKWEQARSEQPYCTSSASAPLGQENTHYQDIYYSNAGRPTRGGKTISLTLNMSPPYYEPEHVSVVPVLSAHSPSVSSEYYIRIEEPVLSNIKLDDGVGGYSSRLETTKAEPCVYWSTADNTSIDSDSSPTLQKTMQLLLSHSSSNSPVEFGHLHNDPLTERSKPDYCKHSAECKTHKLSCSPDLETSLESQTHLLHPQCKLENQHNLSRTISSPSLGFCDPYLEKNLVKESCHSKAGNLRNTLPIVNPGKKDAETGGSLLSGRWRSGEIMNDLFSDGEATNWISNHSANNNSLSCECRQRGNEKDTYLNATDLWSLTKATTRTFGSSKLCGSTEGSGGNSDWSPSLEPVSSGLYFHLCQKEKAATQRDTCANFDYLQSTNLLPNVTEVGNMEGNYERQLVANRESDYSEADDDISDITSGVFTDFNLDLSEAEEEDFSPTKTQEKVPESVDAINLFSSAASSCDQAFSPDAFNNPILPKSLDSGYDTENNESPLFIFKELGDSPSVENCPRLGGESEIALQVGLGQGVCTSASTLDVHVRNLLNKIPYRASAYFSDYDAENERSPIEEDRKFLMGSGDHHWPAILSYVVNGSVERKVKNENSFSNLKHIQSRVLANLSEADPNLPHIFFTPGLSMLSPFPPQMGGCLTKESAPAEDDPGLETEHSAEEPASELSSSSGSESSMAVKQDSSKNEKRSRGAEGCSSAHSLECGCNIKDCREDPCQENENGGGSPEDEEVNDYSHVQKDLEDTTERVRINEEEFEDIDADENDSLCEESNIPQKLPNSSPPLELCGEDVRAPLEEAEDEDDSDESESDEDLRTYKVQEDSEESEEDFTTVPVVVSDCSRARNLRGLLKTPTLLTHSFCDELERKKKAVSFFDDVTVFFFDQESPTGELAENSFSTEREPSEEEPSDSELKAESCDTHCVSNQTDGNNSENGGSYKWEDNHSIEFCPSSLPTTRDPESSPTFVLHAGEVPKPISVPLNRATVSRFSITHVSDTNVGPETGNNEDNPDEREAS